MLPNVAVGMKFKIFVRESQNINDSPSVVSEAKFFNQTRLTGEKAKEFYEDVISTSSSTNKNENKIPMSSKSPISEYPKLVRTKHNTSIKRFKNSDLLSLAQNNDIKNLNKFFESDLDFDIDIVDEFGWTPLMCAACSGAKEAVKILLLKGANPAKMDNVGNTALKLAICKQFNDIVHLLENHNAIKAYDVKKNAIESPTIPFYCDLCKQKFATDKTKHETSTLHVFNEKHKSSTFYVIPESNRGFQLLLKEGWNKERGLGPDGTGRKFPIKANQKKNRRGIGAPEPISDKRNPNNDCYGKYESKKMKMYHKTRDKNFSRNFRLQFFD